MACRTVSEKKTLFRRISCQMCTVTIFTVRTLIFEPAVVGRCLVVVETFSGNKLTINLLKKKKGKKTGKSLKHNSGTMRQQQ